MVKEENPVDNVVVVTNVAAASATPNGATSSAPNPVDSSPKPPDSATQTLPFNGHNLPNRDDDNTNKPSLYVHRILVNLFLMLILLSFFMDTLPQESLQELTLEIFEPLANRLWEWRNVLLYESGLRGVLVAIGLDQQAWTVYDAMPDHTNVRHKAFMRYENGTLKIWNSPDWSAMPWWLRKRYVWQMGFYKNMDQDSHAVLQAWTRTMAKEHGPGVSSIQIETYWEVPPDPPEDLGLWDPAKQPMIGEWFPLFTLNICDDFMEECPRWANNENQCEENTVYMIDKCRRSCNFCQDVPDIKVGSRVALYFKDVENKDKPPGYYKATVLQVKSPLFLLEYDDPNERGEYVTWVQKTTLYEQKFRLLDDGKEKHQQYEGDKDDNSHEQDEDTSGSDEL